MKKRISFLIVLLMILCLTLAGCAQRDNHAGATSDPTSESHEGGGVGTPDNSEPDPGAEPGGDDTNVTDEYLVGITSDGKYSYNINGVELSISTDVSKYIDGNIFLLTDLAYDLGWHVREPNDPEDPNVMRFWNDSEDKFVGFGSSKTDENKKHYYDWVSYDSINVSFDRLDLYDDSMETFYVNRGGIPPYTINRAQVIILAYLFENAATVNDPLDGLVGAGSETHYRIHQ